MKVFLLSEFQKGDQSLWFPYLNTLPMTVQIPLNFSEEELHVCKGTNLWDSVQTVKKELRQ